MEIGDLERLALQAIADRHEGVIPPAAVIAAARPADSPLHRHFTWNVKKAAEERWLDQACALIRSFKVEITYEDFTFIAPAFIRDPSDRINRSYASLGNLQSDEDNSRIAVIREFSIAANALKRARVIAIALGMADQIETLHAEVDNLIAFVQKPPSKKGNGGKRPRAH